MPLSAHSIAPPLAALPLMIIRCFTQPEFICEIKATTIGAV
jgi:hypothetical protein